MISYEVLPLLGSPLGPACRRAGRGGGRGGAGRRAHNTNKHKSAQRRGAGIRRSGSCAARGRMAVQRSAARRNAPGLSWIGCVFAARVEALLAGGDEVVGVDRLCVASHFVVPAAYAVYRSAIDTYCQRLRCLMRSMCAEPVVLSSPQPPSRLLPTASVAHQAAMVPLGQPLQRGLQRSSSSTAG